MTTDSFFETYELDAIGSLLGTGHHQFTMASGLRGLAKVNGDALEVLAVFAEESGRGKFRDFITAAKLRFDSIVVLDVWSPILDACLQRYGFSKTEEKTDFGSGVNFEWAKTKGKQ